jgi:hypothetical protein
MSHDEKENRHLLLEVMGQVHGWQKRKSKNCIDHPLPGQYMVVVWWQDRSNS